MDKRYSYVLILLISLFIGFGLIRLLITPLNFWVDELYHVFAAQGILETGQPVHPSGLLYTRSLITTFIVAVSFQIFGISEFAARIPFLFIGAAIIPLSYLLTREFFDQRAAIITAILLAFSPWQIYWSTIARMYIILQLVFVLYIYLICKAWDEWVKMGRITNIRFLSLIGASFVMIGVALQVHYLGILFVAVGAAFLTALLWDFILKKYPRFRTLNSTFLFIAIVTAIAIAVFLTDPFGIFSSEPGPIGMRLGEWFYLFFFGKYFLMLGLFAVVAFVSLLKQEAGKVSLLILGFFIPLIFLSLFLHQKDSRYIFFIFPLLVILSAYGICIAWDWYRANRVSLLSLVVPVGIGMLLLLTGFGLMGVLTDDYQPLPYEDPHPHWNYAAAYVESNMQEGDVVLSTMPVSTLYYLGKTDYWLRQNEFYGYTNEKGVVRDQYTGAVIIIDNEMLIRELSGRTGWLIADRKLESYFTDPDVLAYVKENMSLVTNGSDYTIRVYRFGQGNNGHL